MSLRAKQESLLRIPYSVFRTRRLLVLLLTPILITVGLACGAGAAPMTASSLRAVAMRWGFYVTYNPNSLVSLRANVRSLNYVSPWYFNLRADGQVTGSDQAEASGLITGAGAKSLPMIKNTSAEGDDLTALLSDPDKMNAIVDSLDSLVSANGYDGVTIDFEAVNPQDKTRLTIFISRLYDRLHPKGKLVAVIVAPKTRDISTGWAAAYDYPALGKVADYVLVMAYDYAWANSDPGPIAPISKLRDTAAYTLARIPAGQVIWGVGVYGYDWVEGPDGKSLGKADARTWAEANAIAQQPDAQSGYDTDAQAPWARYTLDGQLHEVWYENSRSFEAKLGLITSSNMAGFALWRLGQEDPGVWNTISTLPTPLPVTATPRFYQPSVTITITPYVPATPLTRTPLPPTRTLVPPTPTLTPTPTPKPAACLIIAPFSATPDKIYFPQTGHSLGGAFLKYWQQNGGLPVYGYPVTEEFVEKSQTDGKPYMVQYFERNRFEYHPENQPEAKVLLGLLGVQAAGKRTFPAAGDPETGLDTLYFPQVKHTLGGPFLKYWQNRGGLRQFGYPISEPMLERSQTDGKTYTVQYLERARFEYHPEYAGTDAEVLLSLLGLNITPCR